MSDILLETKGNSSSGKHTCHINKHFLFVKDRLDAWEMDIEYFLKILLDNSLFTISMLTLIYLN